MADTIEPNCPLYADPLLIGWVLFVVGDPSGMSEHRRQGLLDTFFNDEAIDWHLSQSPPHRLASLFMHLPVERFRPHVDAIAARWPGWTGTAAVEGAAVLARLDPDRAAAVFERFCADELRPDHEPDVDRLTGVTGGLRHLPDEAADRLFTALADPVRRVGVDMGKAAPLGLIAAGIRLDRPETPALAALWLADDRSRNSRDEYSRSAFLAETLFGTEDPVAIIWDRLESDVVHPLAGLAGIVFASDVPLAELDAALDGLREGDDAAAQALIARTLGPDADAVLAARLGNPTALTILRAVLRAGDSEPPPQDDWLWSWRRAFALATLVHLWRQPRVDLSGLTWERALAVIATGITLPEDTVASALPALRAAPAAERVERLSAVARADWDSGAANNALFLMGELGDPAFLPEIVEGLEAGSEKTGTAAERAAAALGDLAIDYFDRHIKDLPPGIPWKTADIAARIATPRAIDYLNRHFEVLYESMPEFVTLAIIAVDDPRLNDRLRTLTGKGDCDADWGFAVLAKLHGWHDPQSTSVIAEVEERERKTALRAQILEQGLQRPTPTEISLKLRCRACGHLAHYEVRDVWLGENGSTFLPGEIACRNCGALSDVEFTPEATMAVSAELLRLHAYQQALGYPDPRPLVHIISFDLGDGLPRPADAAIAVLRAATEEQPDDAHRHLRLANFLLTTAHRPTAAAESYARCLQLDPTWIEAGLRLAMHLAGHGERRQAFDVLDRGLAFAGILPCRPPATWPSLPAFIADYVRLYNELAGTFAPGRARLHPSRFKTRLGRNDPCPLGTGKKVKKCCGGGN